MERLLDEGWSMRALVRGASKLGASVRQHVEVVEDVGAVGGEHQTELTAVVRAFIVLAIEGFADQVVDEEALRLRIEAQLRLLNVEVDILLEVLQVDFGAELREHVSIEEITQDRTTEGTGK